MKMRSEHRRAANLAVLLAGWIFLGSGPAQAIPDANTPTLIGGTVGAELGVAGQGVGTSGIPYYLYASAGFARAIAGHIEYLNGGGYRSMTLVSGQFSALPLPLVTTAIEPGITWAPGGSGPSLGIRATGSLPGSIHLTGYARVHYLNSRATTEFGVGADYPITKILRASISGIKFNGGFEPSGGLILVGLKATIGR